MTYDQWKLRSPEDEFYRGCLWGWPDEEEEYRCTNCGNSGWDWENAVDENGREYNLHVPCGCRDCYMPCPDIEDAIERSGERQALTSLHPHIHCIRKLELLDDARPH